VITGLTLATPAQAATIDDAVAALKDAPVYVADGVSGTSPTTANELTAKLNDGDNIAIVMLPADAGDPSQLAAQIDQATGHKRVIGVSVGDQLEAAAAVMPLGVAADLMSRAQSVSTSTIETLSTYIRNVHNWQDQHPHEQASKPTKKDDGLPLVLFVVVFLAALGSVVCVIGAIRKASRQPGAERVDAKFKASPDKVRDLLKSIMDLRPQVRDPDLVSIIETACQDTEEYFKRSATKGKENDDTVVFTNHLQSVRGVLVQYIDIQTNPRFYEDRDIPNNPQKLLRQGYDAVQGFAVFVEDSIRRGRRSELTAFQVDTKILSAQQYR
jgi:hypothetical protein